MPSFPSNDEALQACSSDPREPLDETGQLAWSSSLDPTKPDSSCPTALGCQSPLSQSNVAQSSYYPNITDIAGTTASWHPLNALSLSANGSTSLAEDDADLDGKHALFDYDRSLSSSPCPSLVDSVDTATDTDNEEEPIPQLPTAMDRTGTVRSNASFAEEAKSSAVPKQQHQDARQHSGHAEVDKMAPKKDRDSDDESHRERSMPGPAIDKKSRMPPESLRFACPFRKHDPLRFNIRDHYDCSAESFGGIAKLKEHLAKAHAPRTSSCAGCRLVNERTVTRQSSTAFCPRCEYGSGGHMSHQTLYQIQSECAPMEAKWRAIYEILFGNAVEVPEQYFEPPIDFEEVMDEFGRNLDSLDYQVKQETERLIPQSKDLQDEVSSRLLRACVFFVKERFLNCEKRVRGAPSRRVSGFWDRVDKIHGSVYPSPTWIYSPRDSTTDRVTNFFEPRQTQRPTALPIRSSSVPSGLQLTNDVPRYEILLRDGCETTLTFDHLPRRTIVVGKVAQVIRGFQDWTMSPELRSPQNELASLPTTPGIHGADKYWENGDKKMDLLDDRESSLMAVMMSTMIQGSPETAAELHESDDSPTGDEEMNASNDEEGEDDEIDQVAGKICDLILQHFGGPGNGNFDDMIRIVESSATKFVIKLLNDLINCPQVVKCVQHEGSSSGYTPAGGEGNTQPPAGHGTRGPGDGVSDDEATGRGTGGGDNSPGSGENGMLDAKDLRPSYSPISCPFRKRNPLRFNPVDFHACATTAWNSLPLLKRHIKNAHKKADEAPRCPHHCQKCKKGLLNEELLNQHLQQESCVYVESKKSEPSDPEDGITAEIGERLTIRGGELKIGNWHALWRVVFPEDLHIPPADFIPPDEVEEIRKIYGDQEQDLARKLESLLHSALPEKSPSDREILATKSMALFRGQITQMLNTLGLSRRSAARGSSTRVTKRPRKTPQRGSDAMPPIAAAGEDNPHKRQRLKDGAQTEPSWVPPPPSGQQLVPPQVRSDLGGSWEDVQRHGADTMPQSSAQPAFGTMLNAWQVPAPTGRPQLFEAARPDIAFGPPNYNMDQWDADPSAGPSASRESCSICEGLWPCNCLWQSGF